MKNSLNLLVHKIYPVSFVDGPGNRFTLFLQECRFRCVYCHNPETLAPTHPDAHVYPVAELVSKIKRLSPFLSGVSLSGGEPTCQLPAVITFLRMLKESCPRLSTLIQTNGAFSWEEFKDILPYLDHVMMDLKCFDDEKHYRLTGGHSNQATIANLHHLSRAGKLLQIRTTLDLQFMSQAEWAEETKAIQELANELAVPYYITLARHHHHYKQ